MRPEQTIEELRGTLAFLRNEVVGILNLCRAEVVAVVGVTNVACLERRIEQARLALAELAAPQAQEPEESVHGPYRVRCDCYGCPETVPGCWATPMCRPCAYEECEHDGPAPAPQPDKASEPAEGSHQCAKDVLTLAAYQLDEGHAGHHSPEPRDEYERLMAQKDAILAKQEPTLAQWQALGRFIRNRAEQARARNATVESLVLDSLADVLPFADLPPAEPTREAGAARVVEISDADLRGTFEHGSCGNPTCPACGTPPADVAAGDGIAPIFDAERLRDEYADEAELSK